MSQMQTCSVHTQQLQASRQTIIFVCHVSCSAIFLMRSCGLARGTHEMPPPSLNSGASPRHASSQQPPSGAEEAPRRIASRSRMRERPNSMKDASVAPKIYHKTESMFGVCLCPPHCKFMADCKEAKRKGGRATPGAMLVDHIRRSAG